MNKIVKKELKNRGLREGHGLHYIDQEKGKEIWRSQLDCGNFRQAIKGEPE